MWGGFYERGLIWRSRWITDDGVIECREALALPSRADRAVVLRRVQAVQGRARVRVVLDAADGVRRAARHPAAPSTARGSGEPGWATAA